MRESDVPVATLGDRDADGPADPDGEAGRSDERDPRVLTRADYL